MRSTHRSSWAKDPQGTLVNNLLPRAWVVALVMQAVCMSVQERANIAIEQSKLAVKPRVHSSVAPIEVHLPPVCDKPYAED